jgi:hypothetical protein
MRDGSEHLMLAREPRCRLVRRARDLRRDADAF